MPDNALFEHHVRRDWPRLNEQYVYRSGIVLDLSVLASWMDELDEMNLVKGRRPFEHPRSFISLAAFMRDVWRLTYRAAEGVLRVLGSMFGFEAPDYTTLWRREAKEEIDALVVTQAEEHVLAADSPRLSNSHRGEWMAHKYRVPRPFVKLHAAVDIATLLVVHERNLLSEKYWRYVKRYGRRWSVEGAFSALKRTLGESLRSRRDDLILKEALRKVAAYNRLLLA